MVLTKVLVPVFKINVIQLKGMSNFKNVGFDFLYDSCLKTSSFEEGFSEILS
jgi:hypothetical protein